MEQFIQILQHIDIYSIIAGVLSAILATIIPIFSFKYRKLIIILKEVKKMISWVMEACEDGKITDEEVKIALKYILTLMSSVKAVNKSKVEKELDA